MKSDLPQNHILYLVISEIERLRNFEDYMMCTITEISQELKLRSTFANVNGDDDTTTPNKDVSNGREDIVCTSSNRDEDN